MCTGEEVAPSSDAEQKIRHNQYKSQHIKMPELFQIAEK